MSDHECTWVAAGEPGWIYCAQCRARKPGTVANTIKDSGRRQSYESGMVRDVTDGKVNYLLTRSGPMYERWALHLTRGGEKYSPDNWLQAAGPEELRRFRESAARHFDQWLRGDEDEDHAAAVFFNCNGAEYVKERLRRESDEGTQT